jgi:F0F1-type ATP synthase assembly protein I
MGFEFTSGMIEAVIGYVQDFFSDMSPLIFIVASVSLGLFIFEAIVSAFRKKGQ